MFAMLPVLCAVLQGLLRFHESYLLCLLLKYDYIDLILNIGFNLFRRASHKEKDTELKNHEDIIYRLNSTFLND